VSLGSTRRFPSVIGANAERVAFVFGPESGASLGSRCSVIGIPPLVGARLCSPGSSVRLACAQQPPACVTSSGDGSGVFCADGRTFRLLRTKTKLGGGSGRAIFPFVPGEVTGARDRPAHRFVNLDDPAPFVLHGWIAGASALTLMGLHWRFESRVFRRPFFASSPAQPGPASAVTSSPKKCAQAWFGEPIRYKSSRAFVIRGCASLPPGPAWLLFSRPKDGVRQFPTDLAGHESGAVPWRILILGGTIAALRAGGDRRGGRSRLLKELFSTRPRRFLIVPALASATGQLRLGAAIIHRVFFVLALLPKALITVLRRRGSVEFAMVEASSSCSGPFVASRHN